MRLATIVPMDALGMQPSGYAPAPSRGEEPPETAVPVVEVILRHPSGRVHTYTLPTRSTAAARVAALRRHPKSTIISHRTHLHHACTGFTGHGTHPGI